MPLPDSSHARRTSSPQSDQASTFIGRALEEKPVWARLYESLRDTFFPPLLPPLELTSTPIAVPDRMAGKANLWALGTAALVNGSLMALLVWVGVCSVVPPHRPGQATRFTLSGFPILAPQKARRSGGGGGGGTEESIDPIKGREPRIDQSPLTPPQVLLPDRPKLSLDSAIAVPLDVKLPDNPALPDVGVHASVNVTLLSNGPGDRGAMGSGTDGGLGPGHGIGFGSGLDQGASGGPYIPGQGGVTSPVPIITPEAEFSDQARRSKFQGLCLISLIVDAHGNPVNPRVVRRLGMGLDEKALEAVRRYRFKPAMRAGRPVPVLITVAVDFRLY